MLGTREQFITYDRIKFPFLNDIDFEKRSGYEKNRMDTVP